MEMIMTDPKVTAAIAEWEYLNRCINSPKLLDALQRDIERIQLVPVPIVNKDFTPLVADAFEAANGEEDGVQAALDLQASHAVKEWDGE